jgi:site-specific DNA-methyltransferase (adenine-specific)
MTTKIAIGDARKLLKIIPSESINTVVTSPPYWMLRDYNAGPDEIGRERTIKEYIASLMEVIDQIYRILMPHGTFFLNLGDTYSTQSGNSRGTFYAENGRIQNVSNGDTLIKSGELEVVPIIETGE